MSLTVWLACLAAAVLGLCTQHASATASSSYPLHEAAGSLNLQAVKKYISKGVNTKDDKGYTPLLRAVDSSTVYWHPEDARVKPVLEYLLSKGADPNIPFPSYGACSFLLQRKDSGNHTTAYIHQLRHRALPCLSWALSLEARLVFTYAETALAS